MEYGWEFFWTVAASSAGSTALIAIAAFLGKGQLMHWLSKDLEQLKGRLAQDLETHKTQLMRDTERIKTASDIKKATALLVAERRFTAYADFFRATTGTASHFINGVGAAKTPDSYKKASAAWDHFRDGYHQALPFLTSDDKQVVIDFMQALGAIFPLCAPRAAPLSIAEIGKKIEELGRLEATVEMMLLQKLTALEKL